MTEISKFDEYVNHVVETCDDDIEDMQELRNGCIISIRETAEELQKNTNEKVTNEMAIDVLIG